MTVACLVPFVYLGQRIIGIPGRPVRDVYERCCYRLLLVHDGSIDLATAHGRSTLRPGIPQLAEPGDRAGYRGRPVFSRICFDLLERPRERCDDMWIPGNLQPQPRLAEVLDLPWSGHLPEAVVAVATDAVRSLATMQPKRTSSVLRANATLARLLAALIDAYAQEPPTGARTETFTQRVETLLMRGAAGGLGISDAAEQMGLSTAHLCKRYRSLTGRTPGGFLTGFRIERAKRLLAETREPIASIARSVGFGHESSLRTAFRQHVGMSPSAFREANLAC